VGNDDWRLRIELAAHGAGGLLARLSGSHARHLAHELERDRLVVSHDDDTVFVYASSQGQLERAQPIVEAELAELELTPRELVSEHWLDEEDRWDSEAPRGTVEEETVEAGYAPWEVRIPCRSHREARELADRLDKEGWAVVRRVRRPTSSQAACTARSSRAESSCGR
jgi:hypothetical protein